MQVRVLSQRGGDLLRGKLVSVHPRASKTATLPATGLERVSTWLDSFSGRIGAGLRGDQIRSPSLASENRKPGLTLRSFPATPGSAWSANRERKPVSVRFFRGKTN
jgi:hypothetical protein